MDRQVYFDSTNERKKEEEREEGVFYIYLVAEGKLG